MPLQPSDMEANEHTVRLLSKTVLYSVQVLEQVRDAHWYRELQDAIERCIRAAVRTDASRHDELSDVCRELHRCLQDIGLTYQHAIRPLLLAERHVLLLLLHVRGGTVPEKRSHVPAQKPVARISEESGDSPSNGHISESAQQVLLGIQRTGPVRAKDIIAHCRPFSERTVRRSLKELVDQGLVVKDSSQGGVRYRVARESDI